MPASTPPAHRAAAVGKLRHLSDSFDDTGWSPVPQEQRAFGLGLRHSAGEALPSGKRLGQGRLRDREVGRRRDRRSCLSWRSVPPLSMPFSARPERRELY